MKTEIFKWWSNAACWFFFHLLIRSYILLSSSKDSPNVGLEPTTVGLRVQRSTDWASRALSTLNLYSYSYWKYNQHCLKPNFHLGFTISDETAFQNWLQKLDWIRALSSGQTKVTWAPQERTQILKIKTKIQVSMKSMKNICQKWDSNPRLQLETRTLVNTDTVQDFLSLAP